MAHIKSALLGLNITADSDRQMMSKFYIAMSKKIPLFARRVHDYMTIEYIPKHPKSKIPICARTVADLSPSMEPQHVVELPDGWVANLCRDSNGYKSDLERIAEAFGIVIDAQLHGRLETRQK